MLTEPTNKVYDSDIFDLVLRVAALPVLIGIVIFIIIVTNRMMSPKWQEARRNKQIRKAVAARQVLMAKRMAENEGTVSEETPKHGL